MIQAKVCGDFFVVIVFLSLSPPPLRTHSLYHYYYNLNSSIFIVLPVCGGGLLLARCIPPSLACQIAREAEAAMFHRQVFEDLRRSTPHCKDPAEAIAIGAVEASFKSLASAIIVLTGSGR